MPKSKKLLYLLFFTSFALVGCEDENKDYIRYENKSDMDIYIYESYMASHILPYDRANLGELVHHFYKSGRFQKYTAYIYPDFEINDSLFLTVISLDTINKYSWETVRDHQMILRRDSISLSKEYLKKIDYKIMFIGPGK